MGKFAPALIAGLAALAMAAPAMASTTIDFANIKATWFDVQGGSNINYTGNGTANATVSWGVGNNQSGYRFEAIGIPTLEVDPITNVSAITNIGQFTHFNFPINAGTSITGVKLQFTTDVLVNGGLFGTVNFIYAFDHDETPNNDNPCAYGGANNQGVNINGCADRVAVNFNQSSGFFSIGSVDYALDVRGFLVDGEPKTNFLTIENATNTALLRGQVVLRDNAGVVPEPATWAMMIAGFGLVGAVSRRREHHASRVAS